jgi:hypothetical protein
MRGFARDGVSRGGLALAGLALSFALTFPVTTQAQPAPGQRVVGQIAAVEGAVLTIKTDKGEVKLRLADKAAVYALREGTIADVKPGAFIGVGAMPMADGTQRAIQVTVFSEPQRGTGEGHRPWTQPGSTMTNATVDTSVAAVEGRTVTVRYPDGEQRIVIPPDLAIRSYSVGERSELRPGAHVAVVGATKAADGMLQAGRINVGRGGVIPR